MRTLGIIAGFGRLPVEVAKAARSMGDRVVAIGVLETVDAELKIVANTYYAVNIGLLHNIIETLKQEQVSEVILIGKVNKELLFQGIQMDHKMQLLLAGLPNHNDDTLMMAFVKELMASGIKVLDQTSYIRPLVPQEGVITTRQPSDTEWQDIKFGFSIAKEIGRLDIGQTVIIKDLTVMAVEAIEGTDAAIRRGSQLAKGGAVVVKTAKPQQDVRFDMPGIGPNTLQSMIDAGAVVLAIEAGKTLLVDREQVVRLANEHGIVIVATNG